MIHQRILMAFVSVFMCLLSITTAHAQGQLSNGLFHDGAISISGETDQWTFTCDAGVTLWIRVAEQSGTLFDPELRLFKPGSASPSASNSGTNSTAISHTTTVAGTYTIEVRDSVSTTAGTGTYRLYIAAPSLPYTTPQDDQGGNLSNGMFIDGRIDLADIDIFTVQANALEDLRVQIARTTTGFTPFLAIYGPNGALLNYGIGSTTKATVTTTVAGTYTVIVFDTRDEDGTGSGNYRLYMARSAGPHDIPPGDQGGPLSSGLSYDGAIDPADMDAFQLEAVAGELLSFQLADISASSFTPAMRLYAPDGSTILSTGNGASCVIHHQTTVAGTYSLVVHDGNSSVSGSGNYRLSYTQSSKPSIVPGGDEGGQLTNGGNHDGIIGPSDIDAYHIELDAGDQLLLKVADTSNSAFDPVFTVCGPDGKTLGTTTWNDNINFQASAAGTYTLFVRDGNFASGETGTYRLYCAKTPGTYTIPAGDQGGAITSGGIYNGTCDLADIDIYHFAGTAGAPCSLQVTDSTATSFQPKIEVYDPNGNLVGDSFGGTTAQVNFTPVLSGEYIVFIQDSSGTGYAGEYTLAFDESPGSAPAASGSVMGTLASGATQSGAVSNSAMDRWEFAVQAGQEIWIQISVGLDPLCDFGIYAPDGSVKAYAPSYGGIAFNFKAQESGTYTAMVRSRGAVTSNYKISHAQLPLSYLVPPDDEGGMMENGHNYSGSLILGDIDVWEFQATASDRIWFHVQEVGGIVYSPQFAIYSPSGKRVCTATDVNQTTGTFTASETGAYKVLLGNYFNSFATGYQVVCAKVPGGFTVPPGDQGGSLENGMGYGGEITAGDVDLWTFNAETGEKILLQQNDNLSSNFLPHIRVYSPSGKLMASAIHSNLAAFSMTAIESGACTVQLSGHNGSTGNYHLYLAKAASPYSVPAGEGGGGFEAGDMPGGSLPPGGIDMWSFHGASGDLITLNLANTSGSPSFSPVMLIYGPDGSLFSGRTSSVSFIASLPGTYTVVILEEKSQMTGTYTLEGMGMTARPAEIQIVQNAQGLFKIEWPSPSSGWVLQQSENMEPASWLPFPDVPTDNGFNKSVLIDPNEGARCFYRLMRP